LVALLVVLRYKHSTPDGVQDIDPQYFPLKLMSFLRKSEAE
jgi:hypothetical protein